MMGNGIINMLFPTLLMDGIHFLINRSCRMAKYYSKGAWIYAASIYKLTNHIRVSKPLILPLFLVTLNFSRQYFVRKLKVGQALLISLVLHNLSQFPKV